tara:strand:+ start:391 stop:1203 length:813 start_codon:yes stop_codon:yes gene_type:complete
MNFSVLMSIYYEEKATNFNECMDSIWNNQKLKPCEIILVEDGKLTDDLYKCIDTWKNQIGNKLNIIKHKNNQGLAIALNSGIKVASNDIIARIDTDDVCMPDRFLKQIDFLKNNKDVDVVGTNIEEFGDGIKYKKIVEYSLDHKNMLKFFKKRVPLAHSSVMFRKSFFNKAGFYPTSGHISNEDTLLWMNGFKNGCKFSNINIVGIKVRVSRSFFQRRGGLKKPLTDFKNRLEVNKKLNFGFDAFIYAVLIFLINISPSGIKMIAYKFLR